uniref:Protein kinase domain-containing protein n=1 Tax=Timspurckia oligopyrenoides TaxID=708627 RepID=A0A6T6LCZ9_9RHOD|mmetsp:Transcript_10607/g.19126  ORF Transcript_10607/g.19126 Transcript_10607/m.19126 type:complete len:474 (+) Transcript_10607:82-1503(+)
MSGGGGREIEFGEGVDETNERGEVELSKDRKKKVLKVDYWIDRSEKEVGTGSISKEQAVHWIENRLLMGGLRHSAALNVCGWMYKQNKRYPGKQRRYFHLLGTYLSCRRDPELPPSWEIDLVGADIVNETKWNGGRIIIVTETKTVRLLFRDGQVAAKWLSSLQIARQMHVEMHYKMEKQIGFGAYSKVRMGHAIEDGMEVAIKVIDRKSCPQDDLIFLQREVEIVREVDHPNIVQTYDVFENKNQILIVMEFMPGGMLFDVIATYGMFCERDAANVMCELLDGLKYLHKRGVVHRDIKPENILCTQSKWPLHVKWTDFGLSNVLSAGNDALQTQVGTPHFAAPELLKSEPYGTPVDLWSCGIVLYNMLSGELPFDHPEDASEIFRQILYKELDFPPELFGEISHDAIGIIRGLLKRDPALRLNAEQALAMSQQWLKNASSIRSTPIKNDLSKLHSSQRLSIFSKRAYSTATV